MRKRNRVGEQQGVEAHVLGPADKVHELVNGGKFPKRADVEADLHEASPPG
ncbi:MAG: hypothetical protein V3V56_09095 [bacterium]